MRIKDVAREAGVSTATVSHVINNTRFVSEETREKVLRAVEVCNYYPNANARSLASGRSHSIGLLISDISNPFFPELAKSVEAAAFERGYDVILSNTNYDPERTAHYVRRIIERKVAGVALMTSELEAPLIDELAQQNVSVVFLDSGTAGERMSNLLVDYETGIGEAVRHLLALGHLEIAYVGGPSRLRSSTRRLQAFNGAMSANSPKLEAQAVYESDFQLEGGRRVAREMLASEQGLPTAVLAANDLMALGVMQELREAGIAIPQDVSIIGFDDIAFAALSTPPLTTVCLPRVELGRKAVEALMTTIESPDKRGVEIRIQTHLVIRGSTTQAKTNREEKLLSSLST
jgi:LacI family transcriptional regulator